MTASQMATRGIFLALSVPLLTMYAGCAGPYKPIPHSTGVHENHVISTTASIANSYLLAKDSNLIHCNPPPPDAAFGRSERQSRQPGWRQ
jgi:hypothetical protein